MENQIRRVAIYVRVSTGDQESGNQLIELREYCKRQHWQIVEEYIDEISGSSDHRPAFNNMKLAAHQSHFDIILFWALDRFSREGVIQTLNHLQYLQSCGVDFVSYREPYLNSLGIFRDAIIGLLAALAKQEVVRRSERTKAGLARVKAQGKILGRPKIPPLVIDEIHLLRKQGYSMPKIAKKLTISVGKVHGVIKSNNNLPH